MRAVSYSGAGGTLTACAEGSAAADSANGHLVVTYHYIRERNSDGVTGLTPWEVEEQLGAIKARYRVVGVDEFVDGVKSAKLKVKSADPRGLALLTFDDALRDQVVAAEILDKHGVTGVFFAPMRPYSDERDRWCSQHLLHALAQELGWGELERRVEPYLRGVTSDRGAADRLYHYEVPGKRRLKYALAFALCHERAAFVLREINAWVGLRAEDWYLTAGHLRGLQERGHALGGHGFDHVPYSTLSIPQQAADMRRAVATMNGLFGARPRALAYPFGRYTADTAELARACRYTYCFTTEERVDAKYVPDKLR
jgi:peptidoglycan/xylan/chitin deacetylase (PgdA/CDA1 family)